MGLDRPTIVIRLAEGSRIRRARAAARLRRGGAMTVEMFRHKKFSEGNYAKIARCLEIIQEVHGPRGQPEGRRLLELLDGEGL